MSGGDARPTSPRSIDDYLLEFIRTNPGRRFGEIVRAAQAALGISRRSSAWHLARLVRFGDLEVGADHSYAIGNPSVPNALPIVELRWYDQLHAIEPDGTTRYYVTREFRLLSGRMEHMEVYFDPPARLFSGWGSEASRNRQVSADEASTGRPAYFIEFARPLDSRDPKWHRVCFTAEIPREHPLFQATGPRSSAGPTTLSDRKDRAWIQVPAQDVRFGRRLTSDSLMRLQVAFPLDFPMSRVRLRVRLLAQLDRFDSAEEARLTRFGEGAWDLGGLRRLGSIVTLVVPQPLLDRRYEIEWTLPTKARFDRWLGARRGGAPSSGAHKDRPRARSAGGSRPGPRVNRTARWRGTSSRSPGGW